MNDSLRFERRIVDVGFGNLVFADRIVALVSPDSAPIKRVVKEASEKGILIDASQGRRTRTVIVTDSEYIVLSSLSPEEIVKDRKNRPMEDSDGSH